MVCHTIACMVSARPDDDLFDEFLTQRGHETEVVEWDDNYNKKQCPDCGALHDSTAQRVRCVVGTRSDRTALFTLSVVHRAIRPIVLFAFSICHRLARIGYGATSQFFDERFNLLGTVFLTE